MCGIFALLNSGEITPIVNQQFQKGKRRGPETSQLTQHSPITILGFHRLAINGLDAESGQPMTLHGITLICNGEIYNYRELYEELGPDVKQTNSDCEVIIHLYVKYGIEQTLLMLDGVFAFILIDAALGKMYVARDPMGVRPLYVLQSPTKFGFASEVKCLEYFYNLWPKASLAHFKPGHFTTFNSNGNWNTPISEKYYVPSFPYTVASQNLNLVHQTINELLTSAVRKRCLTTERPIACLLSGGLDSSLVAALVAKQLKYQNKVLAADTLGNAVVQHSCRALETYSIGLEGSEDIKYARIVADYIGSKHTEIIVKEKDMFDAIPEVIRAIESYDTTTVRASIGNYLIGKYIAQHSEAKVIFNGDGSDELFGGYLYMSKCPDDIEFDKETRRLLKDIHLFDVLRSDKSISSNGLEPRTPFLDRTLVNYVLSLPPHIRNHNEMTEEKQMEKQLLRDSFLDEELLPDGLLPDGILYRKKEAFSDGVSSQSKSLFTILQEFICPVEPSIIAEKSYYKDIFDSFYPNCGHIVPYYWMPKYQETAAEDPSARTLTNYSQ